ncbi:MAG: phosphoribosylformylglycinamidine synthase subunit PurSL, partial [Candidatus Parcubacteria bacterium]|nr:phosphoribosylformylglycinamidine synthase subunit PurSL [Candidatus Parcubacteria bacterium]
IAAVLTNPHLERPHIGKIAVNTGWNWLIEIGFLPGVTDNVGATARETIEDLLKIKFKPGEAAYYSQIFLLTGNLAKKDAETVGAALYNPLIQRLRLKSRAEFIKEGDLPIIVPKVTLAPDDTVIEVNLSVPDLELARIGKQGIRDADGTSRGPLALDLEYMKSIRDYFRGKRRNPTDIELESIAQTWSEHCKHTIFADPIDDASKGLFKTYIKAATNRIRRKKGKKDICVSVFSDNAGAISFDDKYLVTHKVETHNSPSALDPFGGSITGIVGVNRDAIGFGLGAKPIANVYGFCLADPKDVRPLYRDKELRQKMLPPRRIMDGVIEGVNVGGNCSGIPTPHGFVYFHDRFRGKPLVFVGTVGLIPRKAGKRLSTKKAARPGDYIVIVGGRVGQDGIHGATFSSEGMDAGSPATAVQIGDPITQKKLSDAIVKEARDLDLYDSITDNGAGGMSCSIAEMAKECNGCEVDLDKAPLKYPGLPPWKIWISESQERMTLAVPPKKWRAFKSLMERRGVEATVVGRFTSKGTCVVRHRGKVIMNVSLEFLHNGLPKRKLVTSAPLVSGDPSRKQVRPPEQKASDLTRTLKTVLGRLNIASFEFISTQYDHEVQANSVLKPLQGRGRVNGDAAVIRPLFSSPRGVVISSALFPSYSEIDSYKMAAASIDQAIRGAVAAGGDIRNMAILDNFCWCSSNDPLRLGQLKRAAEACYDYSLIYGTPFISGKDSMFNDFKGFDEKGDPLLISIPPVLLISVLGIMKDAEKAVSLDFKFAGDLIYVLGETREELSGSEYFAYLGEKYGKEYLGTSVPGVDAADNRKHYVQFGKCIDKGIIASAVAVGRGGLAVTLAKAAIGGMLGAEISLQKISRRASRDDFSLFAESSGRILLSIDPRKKKEFEKNTAGRPLALIGHVTEKPELVIRGLRRRGARSRGGGNSEVRLKLTDALAAYKSTFKAH